MADTNWVVVSDTAGSFNAELYKGMLEAQGIPVMLSQEGLGHSVYSLTVGPLGRVEILVPIELVDRAREVIAEIEAGSFEQGTDQDITDENGS